MSWTVNFVSISTMWFNMLDGMLLLMRLSQEREFVQLVASKYSTTTTLYINTNNNNINNNDNNNIKNNGNSN